MLETEEEQRQNMRKRKVLQKTAGILGTALFIILVVFPFYWLVLTSFKDPQDIGKIPTELWPSRFSIEFYKSVFLNHHIEKYLKNSVITAGGAMLFSLLFAFPAAYAFARLPVRFKSVLRNLTLMVNMFPIIAMITSLFVIYKNLKLTNTYWAIIIPSVAVALPMAIWTLEAFIRTIPYELEEAAMIDGAGRFQVMARVVIPLAAPGVFTTGIIAFIGAWNELMFSLLLITRDEMRTVPVAISMFPGEYTVPWGDMAAASIVATIPIVIVVLIFQKRIVSGLTSGGVKG